MRVLLIWGLASSGIIYDCIFLQKLQKKLCIVWPWLWISLLGLQIKRSPFRTTAVKPNLSKRCFSDDFTGATYQQQGKLRLCEVLFCESRKKKRMSSRQKDRGCLTHTVYLWWIHFGFQDWKHPGELMWRWNHNRCGKNYIPWPSTHWLWLKKNKKTSICSPRISHFLLQPATWQPKQSWWICQLLWHRYVRKEGVFREEYLLIPHCSSEQGKNPWQQRCMSNSANIPELGTGPNDMCGEVFGGRKRGATLYPVMVLTWRRGIFQRTRRAVQLSVSSWMSRGGLSRSVCEKEKWEIKRNEGGEDWSMTRGNPELSLSTAVAAHAWRCAHCAGEIWMVMKQHTVDVRMGLKYSVWRHCQT